MSDGDAETLAAIRARAEKADEPLPFKEDWIDAMAASAKDVPWLLARVGQLEAELADERDRCPCSTAKSPHRRDGTPFGVGK